MASSKGLMKGEDPRKSSDKIREEDSSLISNQRDPFTGERKRELTTEERQ